MLPFDDSFFPHTVTWKPQSYPGTPQGGQTPTDRAGAEVQMAARVRRDPGRTDHREPGGDTGDDRAKVYYAIRTQDRPPVKPGDSVSWQPDPADPTTLLVLSVLIPPKLNVLGGTTVYRTTCELTL